MLASYLCLLSSYRDALGGQGIGQFISEPTPAPDMQGLLTEHLPSAW